MSLPPRRTSTEAGSKSSARDAYRRQSVMTVPLLAKETVNDEQYVAIEQRITAAEGGAIWDRWFCGRLIEQEREANGGSLPTGRIDELCKVLGKSRSELQNRSLFARE